MSASPSDQTDVRLRLLVVDDNLDNALLLQTLLEEEGYCVEVADSGQAALQQMRIAPPDLVLLDVMMPEMDGFKVVRKIRGDRRLRATPVILITAYDEPFVEYGWKLGADDFIRKPIDYEQLMQRIRASCPPPRKGNSPT
ncbi:response regulator [Chroococcidiopsis sp. CCMEE 29]|uniref:response regulator n=1 Tax=Chroococcidiopsis sp. CCMEE 29 TaxID=155894 RepID=UPI00202134A9|nr:response regulator [Chroococcidiopsis sp. CCMEE 29]